LLVRPACPILLLGSVNVKLLVCALGCDLKRLFREKQDE
jgi:hypothetical protein